MRSASGSSRFFDLYLIRPDGKRLRRITRGAAFDRYPEWSRDGKWLAFISNRSAPTREAAYEIYVMRANGTGLRRVTRDRWIDDQLAWSPDGRRFAFSTNRGSGRFGLAVINATGTGFHRLTSGGEGLPAWSPDGRTIAYEHAGPAERGIWAMSPDGSNRRQLTFPPQDPRDPSRSGGDSMADWSPTGDRLLFVRTSRPRTDVYVVRADGTGLRRLTRTAGQHTWPSWSPDGKRVVFVSRLGRRVGIYTMNADGSGAKLLITGGVDYAYPDWRPMR